MAVNKVVYNTEDGSQTLIDLTSDSVTPETLAKGVTAHDASGNVIEGILEVGEDTMVGTWVLNEVLELHDFNFPLNFVLPNVADSLPFHTIYSYSVDELYYVDDDENYYTPYKDGVWELPDWRVITITEEPTDPELIAWLKANTKKPGTEVESSNLGMPIIRFANFQDTDGSMCLTETNTFKFTVEVLGGGALREGDLLQICVRRKYKWGGERSKWKLRQVAQRYIESEDIGKRFLSIDVGLGDVGRGSWLFRNDRNRTIASLSGASLDTLSYIYFRIKRVTKYNVEGNECDAIFSNIEKVAKTYSYGENKLTIK